MKRLVYGILRDYERTALAGRCGPEGSAVALLSEGGLAAAYSVVPDGCATPSVAQLQAYAQVVEALHQMGTILPMRHGCLLETEGQIRELLRVRRADSLAALEELDGCMEMGLRILLKDADRHTETPRDQPVPPSSVETEAVAKSSLQPGKSYLSERLTRYAAKDSRHQQTAAVRERFERLFAGLFVKCAVESLFAVDGTLLSLHFLVRRHDEESFRAAFRHFQEDRPEKLLLTGPWPPYHFASCSKANGSPC